MTVAKVEQELRAILDAADRRERLTKDVGGGSRAQVPAYTVEERLRLLVRDVDDLATRLAADVRPRSMSPAKERELYRQAVKTVKT